MKLTIDEIRTLPLPTPQQHRQFVAHLKDAHSWYEHLSLIDGGVFVVFLNPHAGAEYPDRDPSLPGGNDVEGYRQAFGYLDYLYSYDDRSLDRDGVGNLQGLELPAELLEKCSFILYPYVSSEFDWNVHHADVMRIQAGTTHRERSHLLAWYEAARALEYSQAHEEVSKQIRRGIEAYNLFASLQIQEVMRIEYYLRQLYQWHSQADNPALIDLLLNAPVPKDKQKSAPKRRDRELPL